MSNNAGRYCSLIWLPDLDHDEGDEKHKGEHKQRDDAPFTPLVPVSPLFPCRENLALKKTHAVGRATPLEGQAQADDPGQEGQEAEGVELPQLLAEGNAGAGLVGDVEHQEKEQHGGASQG